jgi:putative membrane protein
MTTRTVQRDLWELTAVWAIGLVWSGIAPYDRGTWLLEVLPALIALPLLWTTRHRFAFSTFVYLLIAVHGLILMLGGAYTYARVPLGFWLQDWLHLARNPYDRIGHFAQGFVPALIAREILLRRFHLSRGKLLNFLVVCICLAISAFYELIEWWSALALGGGAEAFLGTQGDPWDTQEDMFMALIGALVAVFVFGGIHDRAMRAARNRPPDA